FQTNAKYNRGYLHYVDPTYLDSKGKLDNTYLQQEYYLSLSALYRATENFSMSLATDGASSSLLTNLNSVSVPTRLSWLSSLAAKYVTNQFLATASFLFTATSETVEKNTPSDNHTQLSPYISLSVKPFSNHDFRLRAFYKNIFRLPSFNDLYYSGVGNRDLKPEKTNQYNLGITYAKDFGKYLPILSLTLDAYHNDLIDKIVAYPTSFFWTIMNKGKVAIDGLDLTAETTLKPWEKIGILLGTTYTYQRALNVTNSSDGDYLHQLPYTPRISGSGKIGLETPWINCSYAIIWSGHRYAVNQNYAENRLPGYADHSISISKTIQTKHYSITGNVEMMNLLNENYAIVKWFPMPGRSFRATFSLKF
ncbi:MAG: TonB-dependent receptor domain-containing protein, partial [Paludibacter sp.]